jgi:hypothetical protein
MNALPVARDIRTYQAILQCRPEALDDAPYDEHGVEEAPDEERAHYPTEAAKILR